MTGIYYSIFGVASSRQQGTHSITGLPAGYFRSARGYGACYL
jgi:hypothetical protein